MTPITLSAASITGSSVVNPSGESLGDVKDLIINTFDGRIAYVVLSHGGFLGMGSKLFAVPWDAFNIDAEKERFVLAVDKQKLDNAPGFDKDHWPLHASHDYLSQVYSHFGYKPFWEDRANVM